MVDSIQYTSINRVLDDLTDHPLLRDLTLEQVIRYTVRFIQIQGFPMMYEDKIENIEIDDFRGTLPCDFVRINQVKDLRTGLCLRSMTDSFPKGISPNTPPSPPPYKDLQNNVRDERMRKHKHFPGDLYIPHGPLMQEELAFKTQGRIIFVTFPHGIIEVSYKSIPVDKEGFPMIMDNEVYLEALETYIKKQVFTIKFDTGKIQANVLENAKSDYAWASGRLNSEFLIPSVAEMESITNMMVRMIHGSSHFINGFKDLGNKEFIRRH